MNSFIDIYCERLGPGLWAEPINALTNASFFIAALFCAWLAKKENAWNIPSITLISLMALIGLGSTLFHTTATFWAMLSDVLPILFYQIAFLLLYSRNVMGLTRRHTTIALMLFVATIFVFGQLPSDWLNGSISYFPALLFLCGFALWHWQHASREKHILLEAAGIFMVSLFFRSVDMHICERLEIGTHFLWHILNGLVLYLTTRAYIKNARSK